MKNWTEEQATKLQSFAEHRDYIVMIPGITSRSPVRYMYKLDDCWFFLFEEGGCEHELDDYHPYNFTVFEKMNSWSDKAPYLHEGNNG